MLQRRTDRPRILATLSQYSPENDATGPVQSVNALMANLKDRADITVLSTAPRSRDAIETPNVVYLDRRRYGAAGLHRFLRNHPHDLVYHNSFFDPQLTLPSLVSRRLGRVPRKPIVLAPRGELAPSALSASSTARKRVLLKLSRQTGLHRDVTFHATSDAEMKDIAAVGLPHRAIRYAEDMAMEMSLPHHVATRPGDALRLLFLARIVPVKNLDYALTVLSLVKCPVVFTIAGPVEDPEVWATCENLIAALPQNVSVRTMGRVANREVPDLMAANDLFFMPSRGENFGHVIHESLMAGTPVLCSDRTPWRNLAEHGAGWDHSLDDHRAFVREIETVCAMSDEERAALRARARTFGEKRLAESRAADDMMHIFEEALAGTEPTQAGPAR